MIVEPLRFEEGVLLVLDQRALPAAETWLKCRTPDEVAEAIRTLAVRGAPAIGLAAAYGMALAEPGEVEEAASLLRGARPTASNLRWAVEQARELANSEGPQALAALAGELHEHQRDADRRMGELGAALFKPGDRALTHCNTGALATGGIGSAGGVLLTAWRAGRLAHVWVDETRPLLQGARLTTWELQRQGVPFQLIADSAAGSLMARGLVDRVIVGADRIAANGDVANKIGTYPLAVMAARHGVPFYVAAPRSTLDPATATGAGIPIEERGAEELTGAAPAGTPAANPAFDVTPAELVTAIVTEAGVFRAPYGESLPTR